ncbi:MAG: SusC/RagA family TonB-linked outer membrane protein [Paludibacteraceae bacterium]|nr:SusC/RagA family TonB-linked outer membrane protein [Paludibacteraceae bacterium]
MKKSLLLLLFGFFVIGDLWAQSPIQGKVVSAATGETIVGASITVLNTSKGTITDFDGKFSIDVQPKETLVISYVGMKSVSVPAEDGMVVSLEEDTEVLDEVVVTALGISRSERTLGYAATKVDADEVVKARTTNVATALAGKVAGVQVLSTSTDPGAASNVIIRGFSSIGGSNQPLYVVDGVPLQTTTDYGSGEQSEKASTLGGISNVSAQDIESMTVLKGAAATALYGSRAANGVIIITTKQGGKGAKRNFNIEYSGGAAFNQVANLPKFQNTFGQGWNGQQTFIENGSWGPKLDGSMQTFGPIWNNQQLLHKYEAVKNNIKDFFETGISHNHNVAFSGASKDDKMTYYASYSYAGDNGVMPGDKDKYQRHTLAFRGSYEPIKYVKISSSINYARSKTDVVDTYQGTSVIDGLYEFPRDMSLVDHKDLTSPFNTPEAYFTPYGITNPYWAIENNYHHSDAKQLYGKAQVDIMPIKGLKITYRFGFDYTDADVKIGVPQIELDDAMITDDMGYAPSNMNQTGSVWTTYRRLYELNHDVLASYENRWGAFDLNAVLGVNINERASTSSSSGTNNLTFYTGFWDLSNGSTKEVISESQLKRRSVGLFADITFGYADQLFIDLTMRNDWSSTLPIKKNSYFYPGVTASWIFSELIPRNSWFSFGKLRVAYGMTGNDASVYLTNPTYVQAYANTTYLGGDGITFPIGGTNAFISMSTMGSTDLRPEMTSEAEVGFNVQFFKGRLGLDATYYHRVTKDQIFTLPVDPSTGYSFMVTNFGKVRNQGFELALNTTPVQTSHFRWDLNFNIARNWNKVLELPDGLEGGKSAIEWFTTSQDAVYVYAEVGKPLGQFYTNLPKYTEDGKIIVGSDGLPVLGTEIEDTGKNMQAEWTGGITTSFSAYGVTLSATLDARLGGYMFSRTKNLMEFTGNGYVTTYNDRHPFVIPNSVVDNGDGTYSENTTPIYLNDGSYQSYFDKTGAGLGGEFFLINRSFAKLRNISLTWDLPKKWMDKAHFEAMSITAYVNNVVTWKAKDNYYIDPEATSFATDGDLAAQFGELYSNPTCRQYGFNVNIKF